MLLNGGVGVIAFGGLDGDGGCARCNLRVLCSDTSDEFVIQPTIMESISHVPDFFFYQKLGYITETRFYLL